MSQDMQLPLFPCSAGEPNKLCEAAPPSGAVTPGEQGANVSNRHTAAVIPFGVRGRSVQAQSPDAELLLRVLSRAKLF